MHPAAIAAIPPALALVGKGIDVIRVKIETDSKVAETAVKWGAAERTAKYGIPLVVVSGAGLATYDYVDRRRRIAELEKVEQTATEAGDEATAAAARSELMDLAREDGFVARLLDLSGRAVEGIGRMPRPLHLRRGRVTRGEILAGD